MENNPNNDPTTPESNPAAGQKPEMSLADQILAMKAERDAKAKAQSDAGTQNFSSAAPSTLPEKQEEPKNSAPETKNQPTENQASRQVVNEPGAPEAGGPSDMETHSREQEGLSESELNEGNQFHKSSPVNSPSVAQRSEKADFEPTKEEQDAEEALSLVSDTPVDLPNINTTSEPVSAEIITENSSDKTETTPVDLPAADTTSEPEQQNSETPKAPATTEAPAVAEKTEEKAITILGETEITNSLQTPDPEAQAEEHEEHEEEHEETDYTTFSKDQLASEIKKFVSEAEGGKNGRKVTELYRLYQQHVKEERAEALNRFTETGGDEADFVYAQTPEDAAVEKDVIHFREQKSRQAKLQEEVKVKNLQAKKELIEKLRHLVDAPEETQNSINDLKQIQQEWKSIGAVPQGESQVLWNSYHALLDQYYNNRSIFNELKDLDRKRNLEAKTALCERAEALENEESINNSLMELRHLHEEWKNIGPVPQESREPIWERFLAASEKVHERKKAYLNERKAKEESNLISKQDVLKMVEDFGSFVTDRINDWRSKTDEIQKIKDIWEKIGLVPKEKADEINKKFWGAYKSFFHNKNAFFKALDDQKAENLRLKTEMCEYAESLVDNPDFNSTKEKLIQLQKKWKTIGRVPDKHSDEVWHRFRAACNAFFDKKNAEVEAVEAEKERKAAEKRAFVNEFEQRLATEENATEEGLETVLTQWRELSAGDERSSKNTEDKFYQLAEQYIAKMPGLSDEERQDKLFQMEVANLKAHPDNSQDLYKKEQSLRKEIQTLEHAIGTLKTNMEFFAKSKNADQIRNDYSSRINESEQKINELKRRLKLLRK